MRLWSSHCHHPLINLSLAPIRMIMSSPQNNETTTTMNTEDRGPDLRSFVIVMLVVAIASVGLRFWSRSLSFPKGTRLRSYWWDDWVALISLVSGLVFSRRRYLAFRGSLNIALADGFPAVSHCRIRPHFLHARSGTWSSHRDLTIRKCC